MALDKVTTGVIADDAITSEQLGVGAIAGSDIAANVIEVKPHIKPGILQPAVAGKLLDGTTNHSGAYGTAQSDGHSYYYTDIKGSKAIKDPRIGAHFGSQRNMFKSLQLLEQETATHGSKVFSIDGREWLKAVDSSGTWVVQNNTAGNYIEAAGGNCTGNFIEITGYFNDINFSFYTHSNRCDDIDISVNGTLSVDGSTTLGGKTTVESPLGGRYVNASSFINGGSTLSTSLGTTPKINTIRYEAKTGSSEYISINGIDLIAQDTGTDVRRNHVIIPSQNVVSYGKKFSIGSDTLTNAVHKHYNPFAFKTDGSTAWASGAHNGTSWPVGTGSSHNIDTATSLGLENWKHGDNYYKPYNGGRVVKWIASDGTIKTSVTVMPPNARSIGNSASLTNATAKANASIANNTFYPTMEAGTIDYSLSEVAKTFHAREFGNGNANGGAGGTHKDASMLDGTARDISFTLDDGLTSFSGDDVKAGAESIWRNGTSTYYNHTFIGTGISIDFFWDSYPKSEIVHIAENLPYGTHILRHDCNDSDSNAMDFKIDGISVKTGHALGNTPGYKDITFYQPKKPSVPEDACIIADYMLMADYVKQTDAHRTEISKGVRYCNGSRDHFYAGASAAGTTAGVLTEAQWGMRGGIMANGAVTPVKLPFFGTTGQSLVEGSNVAHTVKLNGSATTKTNLDAEAGAQDDQITMTETVSLRQTDIETTVTTGAYSFYGHLVATPIHTSSHYQSFETPFLKELIGGDRNMEQTNLVVTPDGKTWDEVTRDTSYLGNTELLMNDDEDDWNSDQDWKIARGVDDNVSSIQKDFAIAYDRFICLVDGNFSITYHGMTKHDGDHYQIKKNGSQVSYSRTTLTTNTHGVAFCHVTLHLVRGDYIQTGGQRFLGNNWGRLTIERV